mmetsp:Transcript_6694/g.18902  ORF Transcript_6694/g.18902 Transcript_6694/m.18902 type:complete len:178 (-) Transcript_6694:106-639(-)|eukprot:CAMPEP_0119130748 /NCGR_PEP_ID=MMETSP1310-20130426/8624_1 /TAXON_ID=464262 /ORGANISM="Genus nov. species nov., Strain RCC2339" /LENGTH=177 /DNA_ID=CAMNT_0007121277 /DNA_START=57 /DNA_END=590 /DNA_ORIENTATION=+
MPAYHSSLNNTNCKQICSMGLLPLKTQYRGPAPPMHGAAQDAPDIIDEALDFFKANVMFRNYDVQGPADRVLVYLTLYIHLCLTKIVNKSKGDANNVLYQLAIANFSIPGDSKFALGGFVSNPKNRGEADQVRQYITQLRQETGKRLLDRVFAYDESKPDKFWMMFTKRKFLNTVLT